MRELRESEQEMSAEMGGAVQIKVEEIMFGRFKCSCPKIIKIDQVIGYLHEGGVPDKNGTKWWMYVSCPECQYDWSLWKLEKRLQQYEDSLLKCPKCDMRNVDPDTEVCWDCGAQGM